MRLVPWPPHTAARAPRLGLTRAARRLQERPGHHGIAQLTEWATLTCFAWLDLPSMVAEASQGTKENLNGSEW